jgi:hypothetical protein
VIECAENSKAEMESSIIGSNIMSKLRKQRGRVAWLVTRHWIADHPKWEVAAIFSPRLGGLRVREYVELVYVTSGYFTLSEQLAIIWPRYGRTPYAARLGQTANGDPWVGEVLCGDDPFLRARIVEGLKVERSEDGAEKVVWKERPRPRVVSPDKASLFPDPAR